MATPLLSPDVPTAQTSLAATAATAATASSSGAWLPGANGMTVQLAQNSEGLRGAVVSAGNGGIGDAVRGSAGVASAPFAPPEAPWESPAPAVTTTTARTRSIPRTVRRMVDLPVAAIRTFYPVLRRHGA